jgi:PPOX class probable F420-dependent enzyme
MNDDDAWTRVRFARVGRMATVTPSNRPHVVPFVFALLDHDGRHVAYWTVDRKPKRSTLLQRLTNIQRNPAVEFVVDGYDEDWRRLWWVRCAGTARVVEDRDERLAAVDALEAKYPQYRSAQLDGAVVAIDIHTIASWDGVSAPP